MTLSPSEHDPQHFDLAVVGSGILGLAHAYAGVKRGLKVAVFERTGTPLGASVRNFGMGLVTGQPPGIMLDLARESRAIWLHLAARATSVPVKPAPCCSPAARPNTMCCRNS